MAIAYAPCPHCGESLPLTKKWSECPCCGFKFKKTNSEEKKKEKPFNPNAVFDVSIEASAYWNNHDDLVVELKTNLPDETELLLSVSCGNNYDYTDETAYKAETVVVVSDGKVFHEGLLHRNEMKNDGFDLYVSMYLPRHQPVSVQEKTGLMGEYMSGKLVKKDDYDKINHVNAYFMMTFKDDQVILEPSEDWYFTTFFEAESNKSEVAQIIEQENLSKESTNVKDSSSTDEHISECLHDHKKDPIEASDQNENVKRLLNEKEQKTENVKTERLSIKVEQDIQENEISNPTVDKSWSYQPGDLFKKTATDSGVAVNKSLSSLSIISLIVSLVAIGAYCLALTLKIKEVIPVWEVMGVLSIFLPAIAKRIRISKNKSGKGFEIAAIVIGGYAFAMIIYLLTKWSMYFCYLGWIVGGLIYKLAGREKK